MWSEQPTKFLLGREWRHNQHIDSPLPYDVYLFISTCLRACVGNFYCLIWNFVHLVMRMIGVSLLVANFCANTKKISENKKSTNTSSILPLFLDIILISFGTKIKEHTWIENFIRKGNQISKKNSRHVVQYNTPYILDHFKKPYNLYLETKGV
jgi:hypothetical protein